MSGTAQLLSKREMLLCFFAGVFSASAVRFLGLEADGWRSWGAIVLVSAAVGLVVGGASRLVRRRFRAGSETAGQ